MMKNLSNKDNDKKIKKSLSRTFVVALCRADTFEFK
jgi:hypothetical protein